MEGWEEFLEKAVEAYEERKFDVCIEQAKRAIASGCDACEVYVIRASSYFQTKQWQNSIDDFEFFLKLEYQDDSEEGTREINNEIRIENGICYRELKQHRKAIRIFNEIIKDDATNGEAWLQRGLTFYCFNKNKYAIRDFNKAEKLGQKGIILFGTRGDTYVVEKDYRNALKDYLICAEMAPDIPEVFFKLSEVEFKLLDFQKSLNHCSKAILLDDTFFTAYLHRIRIYLELEQYKNVLDDMHILLNRDPSVLVWLQSIIKNPAVKIIVNESGKLEFALANETTEFKETDYESDLYMTTEYPDKFSYLVRNEHEDDEYYYKGEDDPLDD